MIKFYSILFKFNSRTKLFRFVTTDANKDYPKLSLRQKLWILSKRKYENHEHIFYSSYLEFPNEHMSYEKTSDKDKLGVKMHRNQDIKNYCLPNIPKNWMDDYEFYRGKKELENEEKQEYSDYGTADPNIPPSHIPCNGCGAPLHCNYYKSPGFLPAEIFKGRTDNELKTIICQRCHFLKYYNQSVDIEISPESYINTISTIKNKFALAIVMVDLLDFPCSIWPDMHELLGPKRPVFIVGNKVDLLPRDSNSYLDHVKECLQKEVLKTGFDVLNIKHVCLISAKTGYGIEELITQLHKLWEYKGDVYLLGCTNVGKSSLFNILLHSDYCRPQSERLIRKATTCPWPGTTLHLLKFPIYRPSGIRVYQRFKRLHSEKFIKSKKEKLRLESARKTGRISDVVPIGSVKRTIGINNEANVPKDIFAMSTGTQPITTFNENSKEYQQARWVYDTPGVLHPEQITNLLNSHELTKIQPKQMISPRCYRLKPGMSLFVAGLSRLDFIRSDSDNLDYVKIFLFASSHLPTMIVDTNYASDIYSKYLTTPLMQIPVGNDERLQKWPGLQCHLEDLMIKGYVLNSKFRENNCSGDITLSSSGWVGLCVPPDVHCVFRAWTPNGRGINLRTPSLIPYATRLIGKRIRNSLAYHTSKPFVLRK